MDNYTQKIVVDCLEAKQPIGTMYVAVMQHDILEYISYADVRRLENEHRDVEEYIGIQRGLSKTREKEIGKYVNLVDATFPNSIIIAISSEFANYDPITKTITIVYKDNVAKVLDGQHRIAGLRHYEKSGDSFECIVSIYIDMELEDQAIVFATINKEQKNVSNSLVADLFDFATSRSPQKTCHNIARVLNKKEGSPFYRKIKILGTALPEEKANASITQDTFVKSLIKLISKDPQSDRNFYKKYKDKKEKKLDLPNSRESKELIFRKFFIEDETDIKIAQTIWNYFYAVQNKWPISWNEPKKNNILNKSTGYIALMRLLKDIYIFLDVTDQIIEKSSFVSIFDRINIEDDSFTTERYLPGGSGQKALYEELKKYLGL